MANEIKSAIDTAFRDYATDGVPSSGVNKPSKAAIRAAGTVIQTQVDSALNRANHSGPLNISAETTPSIVDDNGDEVPSGTSGRWRITRGTFAAPVTTKGPLIRIDKYENISSAEQANPADNGNNAALAIFTQGSAASEVQTAGIWSYARGAGTTVGKSADVCAMLGIGEAIRVNLARQLPIAGRQRVRLYIEVRLQLEKGEMTGISHGVLRC